MDNQLKISSDMPKGVVITPRMGYVQQFKAVTNYRKSDSEEVCCARCMWSIDRRVNDTYRYFKCKKLGVTCSTSTDIRKSYVCNLFRKGEK